MISVPTRSDFYPPIEPYQTARLALDDVHTMHYEQSGNPHGVPVLFLHGGPGAGASASHRQFFDPAFYRIVIFDQRGAGRSTPLGELADNTTPLLISDIERLREKLDISRWMVFGGSWGSTLALAYAESHPNRVTALVLRGIFLCRQSEIDWFLYGLKNIFPEAWRKFAGHLPEHERNNILKAYYALITDPDPAVHIPAARAWSIYEGSCSSLIPNEMIVANFGSDRVALGLARMESHYFMNNIFLPENYLLNNIGRIRHIPTTIVQGRYDVVCPIVSADDLARAFPEAEYHIINDAGHSAFEPGTRAKLIETMEHLKSRFG
ncbi:MAG: prolyl aminopeptidase [Rhodocyclaceae bacterium]|nr:prolyl aminopeptidase [Rhodocyclaceae bacterium]MCA3082008.1 prolyl aminopeptidase [Rhodocyclaceae bacterium]